jgi:threonine dehydrogenase-like Zn-dependent dehydrogenase
MPYARASVLEEFNEPLRSRSYPVPAELEAGSAIVQTEMAGICGTDVHLWKGQLPIVLPVILGHETVGRVHGLGEGAGRDWSGQPLGIGDRITWNSATSCGRCHYCARKGQPTRCPERRAYGIGYRCDQPPHFLGGYAQYHFLRPGTTIHRVPDDLPTEAVIGAGCALITAIHGVERICIEGRPGTSPGGGAGGMPILPSLWRDSVVVQGAGPVGISALAVAKAAGANQVIVIGGPRARLEMARRFGADAVVALEETGEPAGRIARVRELTGGYGADVVVECVGSPNAVAEGVEMCRDGGKYLVLGHYCDAGPMALNPHLVTRKQLQVFGSWSSEPRHLKAAIEFLRANRERFPFDSMVTDRFPLDRANDALLATAQWRSAKSVIVPD